MYWLLWMDVMDWLIWRFAMDWLLWTDCYGRLLWTGCYGCYGPVNMDWLLWTCCYGLVAMDGCYGLVAMDGCNELVVDGCYMQSMLVCRSNSEWYLSKPELAELCHHCLPNCLTMAIEIFCLTLILFKSSANKMSSFSSEM